VVAGSAFPYATGFGTPFVERWNGRRWRTVPVPKPQDASDAGTPVLTAVSCTAPSACTAVGRYDVASGRAFGYVERWDGAHWRRQALPQPRGADDSELWGLSCSTDSACTAVGTYFAGGDSRPLAEGWDGERWHVQRPEPGDALYAVSCRGEHRVCSAVGGRYDVNTELTLGERWHGRRGWGTQATADSSDPSLFGQQLAGVACPSRAWCMAVGFTFTYAKDGEAPLSESWDRARPAGSRWSLESTPG
jgi:hypothetical protein